VLKKMNAKSPRKATNAITIEAAKDGSRKQRRSRRGCPVRRSTRRKPAASPAPAHSIPIVCPVSHPLRGASMRA
jgi:hypothetical protein